MYLEAGVQAPQCYARGCALNSQFFVPISYLQNYNIDNATTLLLLASSASNWDFEKL